MTRPKIRAACGVLVMQVLAACAQTTAPIQQPSGEAAGTWLSYRIDGSAIPARVRSGVDEGVSWEVTALADTLILSPNGRWEQRVHVRQSQSDGFVSEGVFGDRGEWSRTGSVITFQSTWIENVSFRGELGANGDLVVEHDFTLDEGASMRREMRR